MTTPNQLKQIIVELQRKLVERAAERDEATAQQAATADILKVISRSDFDLQTVLDALVGSVANLCNTDRAVLIRKHGDQYYRVALHGFPDDAIAEMKGVPVDLKGGSIAARALRNRAAVHVTDVNADPEYPGTPAQTLGGVRTVLSVPLFRDTQPVGAITVSRIRVEPFTEKQIDLIKTFADQAMIAMENVRLINETREALERQTATADVLKVIASSPSDVQPVFDAVAGSANRLIGGFSTAVFRFVDDTAHLVAFTPTNPAADEVLRSNFPKPLSGIASFELARSGKTAQIADTEQGPNPQTRDIARARGFRSMLFAPLMSASSPIGVISVTRVQPGTFADHHVQLLQTFADQAVIAIENARLFDEVQARTRDLTESLQQQIATADVLKVISRSAFDLDTVMNTLARSASELCAADRGALFLREDDLLVLRGRSMDGELTDSLRNAPVQIDSETHMGRAVLNGSVANIADFENDPNTRLRTFQRAFGFKSFLAVPLMREGRGVGVFTLTRSHVGAFSQRQIDLVQTFADQAVIAIENVRLFDEVQARTKELATSLDDLRTAQDRLVQTEKLASLGQLTAGIAHEIKNPLNFVNNFSALSAELIEEMKDMLSDVSLDKNKREDLNEITQMLKSNLDKVVQHGKRADSIVKNMLLHSRQGSGEHRPIDINALVDESLNLAYHGARAENTGFNITMHRSFDPAVGMADGYPQEITRALLNLISNGFYAATKRKSDAGDGFEPTLTATTKNLGDKVEIRIRDNGTGIPTEVKEKIFNPFFTTKPAGEGTGLGLSMSHDIVVKQHGGTIDVDTAPGAFAEFRIVLPRAGAALIKSGEQG
jgi:signal transduction histidine kinase